MEGGEEISSGGGDTTKGKYPVGFRFKPTDEELVEYYLLPKLQGKPTVPNDAIIEADVYECDPEILINQKYKDRGESHWYFLSPRTRKYQNGDRPSRRTADNRGRWKPSTGKKNKEEEEENKEPEENKLCGNGAVKFYETTLAYHVGPPKEEKKTKWLMRELTVPEYEVKVNSSVPGGSSTLDRYAMCTIYMSPLTKWYKDEGGDTSTAREAAASSSKPGPAPESDQGKAAPTTPSNRQERKRPAVEQQQLPGRATATKRARQPTSARGPPAPVHGNGGGAMGVPLGVGATGYYVVPGQQAQMPWPPVACNRLQGPVQLSQQSMYQHNGRPVAAPYGGQTPVQGLAGSSLSPPVSAQNSLHRTMGMRPPAPSSFEQKMMRPQNGQNLAAGQTLPPPSAPQPRRQMLDVDMNDPNTQRVISQLLAALKAQESASSCAAQQQGPTASNLPPPQPTFDAGANHPARTNATVPRHPGRGGQQNQQRQQRSSSIPVTNVSVSGGAAAPAEATPASDNASSNLPLLGDADGGSAKGALQSNADQLFADLATMTTMPSGPWMGRVKEER